MIEFRHNCIIKRATTGKDTWDNVVYTQVYKGSCLYEERNSTVIADNIIVRNPLVFLPANDILFEINDRVEVTVEKGRKVVGIVEVARDIVLPRIKVTRLELKLATGK